MSSIKAPGELNPSLVDCMSGRTNLKRGFTMVDLLIGMVAVALLTAIALPYYLEATTRANVARSRRDLHVIAQATEAYIADWGAPPHARLKVGYTPDAAKQIHSFGFYAFTPLTSPVAYMASTTLPDPFCPPYASRDYCGAISPSTSGVTSFTYYYVNILGASQGWAWGGSSYPEASAKNHWAQYLIIALGPDSRKGPDQRPGRGPGYGWSNSTYLNTLEGLKWNRWAIQSYDPSNGARSYGDILRWQER